jgi:hypothetical protein
MMQTPFKKINVEDQELNRVQDAVKDAFSRLSNSPLSGASIVGPVHLVAGSPNVVATLLNRAALGYIVIGRDTNAPVWNGLIGTNLVLYTDVDVTVSLLVF